MESGATIRFFLVLALGIIWYFWPYRRFRIFAYREDVFSLRDELWDFMRKEGFSFENQAYREVRRALNSLIRLAPMINIAFVVCAVWSSRRGRALDRPGSVASTASVIQQESDQKLKSFLTAVMSKLAMRTVTFLFFEGVGSFAFRILRWFSRGRSLLFHPDEVVEQTVRLENRISGLVGPGESRTIYGQ